MARHYFVDYELYSGGVPVLFGHLAVTWPEQADGQLRADALLAHVRQTAADRHAAEAHEIRIRSMTRL